MRSRYIRKAILRNVFIMLFFITLISIGYAKFSAIIHISGTATSNVYSPVGKLLIQTVQLDTTNGKYTTGANPTGYIYQSETLTENNLYAYYKVNVVTNRDRYSSTQTIQFALKNTYSVGLLQGNIAIQSQQNTSFLNVSTLSCTVTAGSGGTFTCPAGYTCRTCTKSEICPGDPGPPCAAGYYCTYNGASEICTIGNCSYCKGQVDCPTVAGLCKANYICLTEFGGTCLQCASNEICFSTSKCYAGYKYVAKTVNSDNPYSNGLTTCGISELDSTPFEMNLSDLINRYDNFDIAPMAVSDTVNPTDTVTCTVTYYTNPYQHTTTIGNIQSTVKLSYSVSGSLQAYYFNIILVP